MKKVYVCTPFDFYKLNNLKFLECFLDTMVNTLYLTASFNSFPTLKPGTLVAGIVISSPV
ncbi:Uncharacterised protein [Priestia megaterium]|nr:Uncharacterised protein [Priestia megaterium]